MTHVPSSLLAERSRSADLDSPVEAQRQCIEELKETLAAAGIDVTANGAAASRPKQHDDDTPVLLAEFNALVERVARLEREIGFDVDS